MKFLFKCSRWSFSKSALLFLSSRIALNFSRSFRNFIYLFLRCPSIFSLSSCCYFTVRLLLFHPLLPHGFSSQPFIWTYHFYLFFFLLLLLLLVNLRIPSVFLKYSSSRKYHLLDRCYVIVKIILI